MTKKIRQKRYSLLIIAVCMCCFFLVSCGKSENVTAVENQIATIGTIDKDSLDAIEKAEAAFGALETKEQKKVENHNLLVAARDEYDRILADEVSALIEEIGTVNEKSDKKISAAESAYSALTDAQKAKVGNLSILETAREEYHDVLIANVEKLIDSIQYNGEEPSSALKQAVKDAEKKYNELDNDLKARVKNYDSLATIIDEISQYYIQQAQNAINAAIESDSGYEEAEKLYNALDSDEKKQISDYNVFTENYTEYKNRPPLDIESFILSKDIIGNPKLRINATNTTDKIIKEFVVYVFAYDSDGVPVPIYFGEYARGFRYSEAIKPGNSLNSSAYWQLYGTYNDMEQFVIVLAEAEFFDGSVWKNNQAESLVSKYDQQLLEVGDKNIVPRA